MADSRRKVLIVGDGACGKTCLFVRFARGSFPEIYVPTILENQVVKVQVDQREVELDLWDTAGQCEGPDLRPRLYTESQVILLAFGIDSPDSLDNVQEKWLPDIQFITRKASKIHPTLILVGCKTDLRSDERTVEQLARYHQQPVSAEEAMAVAAKIGAVQYIECSAKTGEGVAEVFDTVARSLVKPRSKKGSSCIVF
ncbi:small GTPase-binding protein [Flagelloscypha sp. PMI_526]|nr:small GTPase-binding protein [Flagelloscypha sp. PMI_526]